MIDIWRSGFIRRSLTSGRPLPRASEIVWLPPRGAFQFAADPFAIERDGEVTVFVETYDYRVRRGEIGFYRLDQDDRLVGEGLALAEPWHLSYPYLIESDGALFMLPEAHKSRALTLYRCDRFPDGWTPVARLLDQPAVDASVIFHQGRWWMFYALAGADERPVRELHLAVADRLEGPWTPSPLNPVRTGFESSRPGGTAFLRDGLVHLPVQDCRETYGGALNILRIDALASDRFEASVVERLEPAGLLSGHEDGLHTLSGLGGVTCLDVKAVVRSRAEPWLRRQAKLRRLMGLFRPGRPRGHRAADRELRSCAS